MFRGSSGFVLLYDIQLTVIVGRQPYTSKAVAVKLKFPVFLQLFAVRGIQPLKKYRKSNSKEEEDIKEVEYVLHSLAYMFTKHSRTLLDTNQMK